VTRSADLAAIEQGLLSSWSFRNKLINGNFGHWQRGISIASMAGNAFLADRYMCGSVGSTFTASQQTFTPGQTLVPYEPKYWLRQTVTTVAGTGNFANLQQRIESVRTAAGQTVTLSFYAKADAAKNIGIELAQYFGTSGSALITGIGAQSIALTAAWQKFVITIAVPSIAGMTVDDTNNNHYLSVLFWLDAGSTMASRSSSIGQQSITFDIAQVQLEISPVATPFEHRPAQVELSLCMRYYERLVCSGTYPGYGMGGVNSATGAYIMVPFQSPKRATPTTYLSAASTFTFWSATTANISPSALAVTGVGSSALGITATIASGVAGQAAILEGSGTASYIGIDAEL
jgi:hypothetical protein